MNSSHLPSFYIPYSYQHPDGYKMKGSKMDVTFPL